MTTAVDFVKAPRPDQGINMSFDCPFFRSPEIDNTSLSRGQIASIVNSNQWLRFIVVASGFYFGISVSMGQSPQGTITGTVTDSSATAVSDAIVTATALQTNDIRTAHTNKAGAYRIESVQPGDYKVTATAISFARTTVDSTRVVSSIVSSVNLTLHPGMTSLSVEVSENQELLRTDSGELSYTLNMQEISTLPVNSFNAYALATTLPGVTSITTVDRTNGTSFSVNGGRPRDNNFLLEGMDNNDQAVHGQAFEPANLEAVQEVTFLLNSSSAEFGHGGSVSNLIYQSGTNRFHGALWDRLLNSSMNAKDHNDVLNGSPKGKSRENLFGFRIGGPILHDRAFFFVSDQWDRARSTANLSVLTLPTAAGITKLQQYASNRRVANLLTAYGSLRGTNPNVARTVQLGVDPATGVDRGGVDFAGVQRNLGNSSNNYEFVAKGDVNLSNSDKLHLRYLQSAVGAPYDVTNYPGQLPGFDTDLTGDIHNAGINETHIFTPNVLNDLRLSWSGLGFNFDLRPETYANPLALLPAINITGITGYGIPSGGVPQGRNQNTYQLQDAVSWTHGRHFFKGGLDLADIRLKDLIPFNYYGSITYGSSTGYSGLANYLDDFGGTTAPNSGTIQFGNPTAHPVIWSQNYYAQDTWKISPTFSAEVGVRYEYHGTPFNYLGYPGFNSLDPTCFPCNVRQQADANNIAPRLGFNYSPFANGRTVLSGGFGLFYDHIFSNIIDNIQGSAPNSASKSVQSSSSGRGTSNWSNVLSRISNKNPLATDTTNVISAKLLDPENYQWNLRIQQALPASFVLSGAYVGNRGVHQYGTTYFNPTIASGPRLFPTRGIIIRQDNSNDSMYHAGQLNLEHQTRHGFTFRTAYTYSKMLDTGSEEFTSGNYSTYAERQYPNPRRYEWGPSAFDTRHALSITYIYSPPIWHAQGMEKVIAAVVNRWTLAGITSLMSGSPINIELGPDWNGDGVANDRPMLSNPKAPITTWAVRGDDSYVLTVPAPGRYCEGSFAWNTNEPCHSVTLDQVHWVLPLHGTQGNSIGRNAVYARYNQQWDMSMQRNFKLYEQHGIDFRAEAFNVFNHALTNQAQSGFAVDANLITNSFASPSLGNTTFLNYGLTNSGGRKLRFLMTYSF